MITAVTALGALVFTGISLSATRDQVTIAQVQNAISEQGQFTDRYTKAVEQLDKAGVDHLQARLGAIYGLERLAHDSPRDQPTIIEVLSAFIRSATPVPKFERQGNRDTILCPDQLVVPDAQAALAVLGRRDPARDGGTRVDLRRTCLRQAQLANTVLLRADLRGADLASAFLAEADLTDVDFTGANLEGAHFGGARLIRARLNDATLTRAIMGRANLSHAHLVGVDLTGMNLIDATLSHAFLSTARLTDSMLVNANLAGAALVGANLINADLAGANLRGTNLRAANLTGANLRDAIHDQATVVERAVTDNRTRGKWW